MMRFCLREPFAVKQTIRIILRYLFLDRRTRELICDDIIVIALLKDSEEKTVNFLFWRALCSKVTHPN